MIDCYTKSKVTSWFLCLSLLFITGFNTTDNAYNLNDCEILREGTFKYGNDKVQVKVVIQGNTHTEYNLGTNEYIKSKMIWLDDCNFILILNEVTIPDFPYAKGDVMHFSIIMVKDYEVLYKCTIEGTSWNGILIKLRQI